MTCSSAIHLLASLKHLMPSCKPSTYLISMFYDVALHQILLWAVYLSFHHLIMLSKPSALISLDFIYLLDRLTYWVTNQLTLFSPQFVNKTIKIKVTITVRKTSLSFHFEIKQIQTEEMSASIQNRLDNNSLVPVYNELRGGSYN